MNEQKNKIGVSKQWPELRYGEWKDCWQTLHRWTQIIGKVRLTKSPWMNHSWHVPLYVTTRGLTTSLIYDVDQSFSIDFDFVAHCLRILTSDGRKVELSLEAESVASFYNRSMGALKYLGIEATIDEIPNELSDRLPFSKDEIHHSYDPIISNRFWQAMLRTDEVMQVFRSKFLGKVSPVSFFWGSFDLVITRFSGRRAPQHPGGVPNLPDLVVCDAYSHEESSCGFWPGDDRLTYPAFFSYVYPEPQGFKTAQVLPSSAFYHEGLKEFILPYEAVRNSKDPQVTLLEFFQSTYDAAASLGKWDRELLEESPCLSLLQLRHQREQVFRRIA